MTPHFVITRHALKRFVERYERIDQLKPGQYRSFLTAELERGVPFGSKPRLGELLSLACGCVAAVVWHKGAGFVMTVLTREHALRLTRPWKKGKRAAA